MLLTINKNTDNSINKLLFFKLIKPVYILLFVFSLFGTGCSNFSKIAHDKPISSTTPTENVSISSPNDSSTTPTENVSTPTPNFMLTTPTKNISTSTPNFMLTTPTENVSTSTPNFMLTTPTKNISTSTPNFMLTTPTKNISTSTPNSPAIVPTENPVTETIELNEEIVDILSIDLIASASIVIKDGSESDSWIAFTISNTGDTSLSTTDDGVIQIYIDTMDTPYITLDSWLSLSNKDFFNAGQSSTFFVRPLSELSPGDHVVVVDIDSTNLIKETNEDNNRVTFNFTIPTPQSHYVIDDSSIDLSIYERIHHEKFGISFVVPKSLDGSKLLANSEGNSTFGGYRRAVTSDLDFQYSHGTLKDFNCEDEGFLKWFPSDRYTITTGTLTGYKTETYKSKSTLEHAFIIRNSDFYYLFSFGNNNLPNPSEEVERDLNNFFNTLINSISIKNFLFTAELKNHSYTRLSNENTSTTIAATDLDGDSLTYLISKQPSFGTVEITDTSIITYTPNTDFTGVDSYQYTVYDGSILSDSYTITFTILDATIKFPKKVTLIEKITASRCGPCASAATLYKSILEHYSHSQAILLRYGQGGDIYNSFLSDETKTFIEDRKTYYSTRGIPHSILNGKGLESWALLSKSKIDESLSEPASYRLSLEKTNNVSIVIDKVLSSASDNNLKLYTLLIEEEYTFDSPPGTNGQTHFESTVLDLLGSKTIAFPEGESSVTYTFDYPTSIPSIDGRTPTKLALVTFIQDDTTKEVLQATYKKISK